MSDVIRTPEGHQRAGLAAQVIDLQRQLAEAQATIERLAEAHVERFDKAVDRILSKEGNNAD